MIEALQERGDPLWRDYQQAQAAAETAARVARDGGDYPLLSGGDINLYSLFVERAQSLVHPRGHRRPADARPASPPTRARPSSSARSATSGRLAVLYDFENKKVFFPDVDTPLQVLRAGVRRRGAQLRGQPLCLLPARHIGLGRCRSGAGAAADDFATVNPNTGAAPIFRSRRDADITTAIYRRQPVLVDRRSDPPSKKPGRCATCACST